MDDTARAAGTRFDDLCPQPLRTPSPFHRRGRTDARPTAVRASIREIWAPGQKCAEPECDVRVGRPSDVEAVCLLGATCTSCGVYPFHSCALCVLEPVTEELGNELMSASCVPSVPGTAAAAEAPSGRLCIPIQRADGQEWRTPDGPRSSGAGDDRLDQTVGDGVAQHLGVFDRRGIAVDPDVH